jgi:hypothetical protein
MAAFSGASVDDAFQAGFQGAAFGAVTGGFGSYLKTAGYSARVARGLSGGLNGALQTGEPAGFFRGFAAGQLSVDLGIKAFHNNPYANFAISRSRDALEGYIIDGEKGAERNLYGGLVNEAVGHAVGSTASYMEHGRIIGPQFRDGLYYYDSGNWLLRFEGTRAITLGNVVTGENQLYSGRYKLTPDGRWLNEHERRHYFEQSSLGMSYLPVNMLSQWGSVGLRYLGVDSPRFMEYGPLHSLGYETIP